MPRNKNSRHEKSQNAKMKNAKGILFRPDGVSRYLITRIAEIAKCQNAKLRHGVSEITTWRVEMPRNRNL
jgi:hypothetical protein